MAGGFPLQEMVNATDVAFATATSLGTIIAAAGNGTPGSWTQLTSSSPIDTSMLLVYVGLSNTSGALLFVDIGIGAGGSEVVIIQGLPAALNVSNNASPIFYQFPIQIPAGTRIAARGIQGNPAAATAGVALHLLSNALTGVDGFAGADLIGGTTTAGSISPLISSSTANTKGSYLQFVASTSRDYAGIIPVVCPHGTVNSGSFLVDIAIGAAGSEIVILPNIPHFVSGGGNDQGAPNGCVGMFFPVQIPVGTRLAGRCQATGSSIATPFQLYGLYQ